ncbi:MAG: AAA family ATPase [Okeania sp. SIO2H7]|nr:AAA family ATPase [Okeania sp. SIO2H7]
MHKFERISIQGFRCLLAVELEMRPLSVIIGANGAGKTSFLDVFSLLADSAKDKLGSKISEFGGLNDIITSGKADSLAISLLMSVPNEKPLEYYLKITPKGQFYEIEKETLIQSNISYIKQNGLRRDFFDIDEQRVAGTNLSALPKSTFLNTIAKKYSRSESPPTIIQNILASCAFYKSSELNFGPQSPIRLPQLVQPATLPGFTGENLVSCLYYLRESYPDQFQIIEDTLFAAFPDFEKLSFPPAGKGTLAMTWKDKNFSKPSYMHQLSEGTLRFLWLISFLLSPDLPAVTLIDEPEVSLHPELLQLLVDLMREASERSQLIVTTHSDRLIRFLEPKEVVVCDMEDGVTTMKWGDSIKLEHWLKDYSLDQLWAMNIIGGRP